MPKHSTGTVRLCPIYPSSDNTNVETDIDIIAIHGLDTKSPDTWEFRNVETNRVLCNWIQDKEMLPSKVGKARIFTIDWPAEMFEEPCVVPKAPIEVARSLVSGIATRLKAGESNQDRSIYFISSCLGGIILMKALVIEEGKEMLRCTRGITFLATPFRGTAFAKMEAIVKPGLSFLASMKGKRVNPLYLEFLSALEHSREELVSEFYHRQKEYGFQVIAFYEGACTNIRAKALPKPLRKTFAKYEILVDQESGTLQGLDRRVLHKRDHLKMNKFEGPDCGDYRLVAGEIQKHLEKVRKATPIEQMSKALQSHYNKPNKLDIRRLSGEKVSMRNYYINLVLVKEIGDEESFAREDKDTQLHSPFSLSTRIGVQNIDENIRIGIDTLFETGPERQEHSSRVLIRGRAGVGKTTLCKKLVHDFLHERLWRDHFDYIFWLPLRELKGRHKRVTNVAELLHQEFLNDFLSSDSQTGEEIAGETWRKLRSAKGPKALFLLDGLDEISDQLNEDSRVCRILETLMELPNVIVTSRPHVSLPECMRQEGKFNFELEALGFDSDQVEEYIKGYFDSLKTKRDEHKDAPGKILRYLKKYPLIRSLMQIPIQLDALCFTWNSFKNRPEPRTMTDLYEDMEFRLWADYLERVKGKNNMMKRGNPQEVGDYISKDRQKIELLAFTGMYSNVIEFEKLHLRNFMSARMIETNPEELFDQLLGQLSFLRSSGDFSEAYSESSYYFMHLTYQEYFAARYFARQWNSKENIQCFHLSSDENQSISPVNFLASYKYHSRYSVFWRFVAGLLDSNPKLGSNLARPEKDSGTVDFFKAIDQKPLDLLGPSHQWLVMCCLMFQCKLLLPQHRELSGQSRKQIHTIASETEFPESALENLLQESNSEDIQAIVFTSLKRRIQIPSRVIERAILLLETSTSSNLRISILGLLRRIHNLSERGLSIMFLQLKNTDRRVFMAAAEALQSEIVSNDFISRKLKESIRDFQRSGEKLKGSICKILGSRPIPDMILKELVYLLGSPTANVRDNSQRILSNQLLNLPEKLIDEIWSKVEDTQDEGVRMASLGALTGLPELHPGRIRYLLDLRNQERMPSVHAFRLLCTLSEPPDEPLSHILAEMSRGLPFRIQEPREAQWVVWCKSQLSDKTLENLEECLQSRYPRVRCLVMRQMSQRSNLEEPILNEIVNRLGDEDELTRRIAISVLYRLVGLPDWIRIVSKILDWLGKDNPTEISVLSALKVLKNCSKLPDVLLDMIVAYFKCSTLHIKIAAMDVLGVQLNLPELVFYDIKASIKDSDPKIANAAMQAVINYLSLNSSSTLEVTLLDISARMDYSEQTDNGELIRQAAFKALGRQSDLPEDIVDLLVTKLDDPGESQGIKNWVTQGLRNQRHLSLRTLRKIAQVCKPQTEGIEAFDLLAENMVKRKGFHPMFLIHGHRTRVLSPLLLRSFNRAVCWYIRDRVSYYEEGNGPESEKLPGGLCVEGIEEEMNLARRAIGAPPVAVLSSSGSV